MRLRHGLLAMAVAASTAAVAQSGPPPVSGTGITSDLLLPQPLDERPTLQAPTTRLESLQPQPEYPVPLRAAPTLPSPLIEQPVPRAAIVAVEPAQPARAVPEPAPRPRSPRREATRSERAEPPERAKSQVRSASTRAERPTRTGRGRVSVRSRTVGRPLNIMPPVARADPVTAPQGAASAFTLERVPQIPWPFSPPRAESQFNVPGGLW